MTALQLKLVTTFTDKNKIMWNVEVIGEGRRNPFPALPDFDSDSITQKQGILEI